MKIKRLAVLLTGLAILGLPAYADFTTTFIVSGNSASDGRAQDGSATFTLNGSTFTITLTNTETITTGISSTLVGVVFSFDPGDTGAITGITSGSAPNGACVVSKTTHLCTSVSTPASPFGWGANAGTGPGGVTVTTPNLFAGDGSGKPDAIVASTNTGAPSVNDTDGLFNSEHNPYLVSPVTFTLGFTGTITSVDAATLYFGTGGESQTGCISGSPGCGGTITGSTPEPSSIALLGGGLLLSLIAFRRKLRRA